MKKIAIVGVEGSGKTVMMAAMGEQWERPDERGYFLEPKSAETFGFSKSVMSLLRSGKWPNSNNHDEMRQLEWCLRRRQGGSLEKIADVSIFDYAGEAYRQAFGGEKKTGFEEAATALKAHVDAADVLIVLVNLRDIISGSMSNRRTLDAMYITKKVLEYVLEGNAKNPHVAIVLSQADSYRQIIDASGGAFATLKKYLSLVTNIYDKLPVFTASAIDRTVIGDDGLPIPAPDFKSMGLKELMDWVVGSSGQEQAVDESVHNLTCDAVAPSAGQSKRSICKTFYSILEFIWAGMLCLVGGMIAGVVVDLAVSGILEGILGISHTEYYRPLQTFAYIIIPVTSLICGCVSMLLKVRKN